MADYRPIKTKMWNDAWFLKLSTEERVVWFFLLTNNFVHISGIYELPKGLIRGFTGVDNIDEIFEKFEKEGKIKYKDGWVFIRNYLKNQTKEINKQDNIIKGIIAYLTENPHLVEIFDLNKEGAYKGLINKNGSPLLKGLKEYKELKGIEEPKGSSLFSTKPNKKPRKKKVVSDEDKKLHKEAVELIDYWKKKYEDSMGKKPIISAWARYIKQAKPFIKELGLPRMKMLCEGYFATFDDKLFKSNGWNINVFLIDSTINKLHKKYS